MADTSSAPQYTEQTNNTAVGIFGSVFLPGIAPVLKAQEDLLLSAETTVGEWLRRQHDAVVDTQHMIANLRATADPFEALKAQQEWMSRALLRLAMDTAAYQSVAQQLRDRAWTWFPKVADVGAGAASRDAAATRAAGKPLRMADKSS
jgi:hypothetical protein